MAKISRWKVTATPKPKKKDTTEEQRFRRKVEREMAPTKGIILPLYVRMENPFIIGGKNETRLDVDYEYSEDGEDVCEEVEY